MKNFIKDSLSWSGPSNSTICYAKLLLDPIILLFTSTTIWSYFLEAAGTQITSSGSGLPGPLFHNPTGFFASWTNESITILSCWFLFPTNGFGTFYVKHKIQKFVGTKVNVSKLSYHNLLLQQYLLRDLIIPIFGIFRLKVAYSLVFIQRNQIN